MGIESLPPRGPRVRKQHIDMRRAAPHVLDQRAHALDRAAVGGDRDGARAGAFFGGGKRVEGGARGSACGRRAG